MHVIKSSYTFILYYTSQHANEKLIIQKRVGEHNYISNTFLKRKHLLFICLL
jgi:hypothetical protein